MLTNDKRHLCGFGKLRHARRYPVVTQEYFSATSTPLDWAHELLKRNGLLMYDQHQPRFIGGVLRVASSAVERFSIVSVGLGGLVGLVVLNAGVFAALDVLPSVFAQTLKPSSQVCSNFVSPGRPHLPRHDPPLPQQVAPALLGTHFAHSESVMGIVVSSALVEQNTTQDVRIHFPKTTFLIFTLNTQRFYDNKRLPRSNEPGLGFETGLGRDGLVVSEQPGSPSRHAENILFRSKRSITMRDQNNQGY